MRRSRFTPEQILQALRQAEAGTAVVDICRKIEVVPDGASAGAGGTDPYGGGPARSRRQRSIKLFPNGIELIYLKLEAGITQAMKAAVEIKIAGPKPAPGTEVVVSAEETRAADPTP